MVPHIVFRAGPEQPYFPGPQWWDTAVSPAALLGPLAGPHLGGRPWPVAAVALDWLASGSDAGPG
jgi:hypothetical protein